MQSGYGFFKLVDAAHNEKISVGLEIGELQIAEKKENEKDSGEKEKV